MEFPSPGSGTGKADKGMRHSDKEKSKEKTTKEKQESSKGESKGEKDIVEKDDTKAEAVGKVGVVDNGSSQGRTDEVRMVDQQLIAEAKDDTARSLGDLKSFRSLISRKSTNKSQRGTKPGKNLLSLVTARGSTQEQIPVLNEKLTDDVSGPRSEAVREPESQGHAGDYPPIYMGGFVSLIPFSHIYVS